MLTYLPSPLAWLSRHLKSRCPYLVHKNPLDACFWVEPLNACPGWDLRHSSQVKNSDFLPCQNHKVVICGCFYKGLPIPGLKENISCDTGLLCHMSLIWEVREMPPLKAGSRRNSVRMAVVTLTRVKEGLDFPIPFHPYVPRDTWVISSVTSDAGDENQTPLLSVEPGNHMQSSAG